MQVYLFTLRNLEPATKNLKVSNERFAEPKL